MKRIDKQGCGPVALALLRSYTAELFSLEARRLPFDSGFRQSLAPLGWWWWWAWEGEAACPLLDDMTPVSRVFLWEGRHLWLVSSQHSSWHGCTVPEVETLVLSRIRTLQWDHLICQTREFKKNVINGGFPILIALASKCTLSLTSMEAGKWIQLPSNQLLGGFADVSCFTEFFQLLF